MIRLRALRPDDFDLLLDLANQAVPFAPKENAEWLANRKAFDETRRLRRHYLAEEGGRSLGYGCLEQQGDDPSWLRIYVVGSPADMQGEVGTMLYERLLREARELKAAGLWAREYQADEAARRFFTSRRFTEAERFTVPDQPPMVVYKLELA